MSNCLKIPGLKVTISIEKIQSQFHTSHGKTMKSRFRVIQSYKAFKEFRTREGNFRNVGLINQQSKMTHFTVRFELLKNRNKGGFGNILIPISL